MTSRRLTSLLICVGAAMIVFAALAASAAAQAAKERSEIDARYKWRLEDLYPTDDAWEQQYKALEACIPRVAVFKGHLGESAGMLRQCLMLKDSLSSLSHRLRVYANLKVDEDARVSKYVEMSDRHAALDSRIDGATSYIDPEILAIDSARLEGFLQSDPQLKQYRFYIESLCRTKQHVLTDREEELLAKAAPVTGSSERIFNQINNADIVFGTLKDENGNDIQLTRERYYMLLESSDRRVRRDAAMLYYQAYRKYMNGLSATLAASVKKDNFLAQARKYPTTLDQQLDISNIPTSVFRSIIAAANANLAPLHKWASIRKRILGVDTLRTYDLYANLFKEKPKQYSYEEARTMILEALAPLGKAYLTNLQKGFDSGWIDVYETVGKQSGAYNWGTYTSHPYLLMNYSGTLEQVSTLAHELGHAMHAYYTNRNEPFTYFGHSMFTAEVASTCNESIMMKYFIGKAKDKQEKMVLLNKYIEQIIGTFYTQLWFSEFELAIHEQVEKGGALSADFFGKTYRDIYQKYWGPELFLDSTCEIGGIRIPHFYRPYYVYQYATSYAAAQTLSDKILSKEKGALDAYLKFLTVGTSKYPVDILKEAGVDMTTGEPVNRTIKVFADLVDQMEKLLNEK